MIFGSRLRTSAFILLATAILPAQQTTPAKPNDSPVTEQQLLGTWVAVHRSLGGLGSMWTFRPGGKLEMSIGAIVESWYKLDGDRLINPPGSTLPGAKPMVFHFRVEGDTLYQRLESQVAPAAGDDTIAVGEMRYKRAAPVRPGDPPIVGIWKMDAQSAPTAAGIVEAQRKAGHEMDERTAQAMAEMAAKTYHEYTRDGLSKIRLPMRNIPGTYDLPTQTFRLETENASASQASRRGGRFRLENGLLVLTQPDGKTEDTYISADATKEELKRAGVSYGDTAPQLDPP
jgi:hypothetical protein